MKRSAYGNILEISSFAGNILLESGAEAFCIAVALAGGAAFVFFVVLYLGGSIS